MSGMSTGKRRRRGFDAGLVGLAALAIAVGTLSWAAMAHGTGSEDDGGGVVTALPPLEPVTPTVTTEPPLAVHRPGDGPMQVLFAGDSLTGSLFASSEAAGYRPRMIDALDNGGPVDVERGSVDYAVVGKVASIVEVPEGLNLAVVELGTNDVGKTEIGLFTQQYGDLLDRIREKSPDATLLCAGTWQSPAVNGPYDAAIKAECAEHNGRYVPLVDLFEQPALRGPADRDVFGGVSDNFHPNDDGYAAISDRLLAEISY